MPTNFPNALDDFPNPNPDSKTNEPGMSHSGQHANHNDTIEALQKYVGIINSVDPTTLTYKINTILFGAPTALDTLAELAAALDNNPTFAATITNTLAAKVDKTFAYATSGTDVVLSRVTGDSQSRFTLNADGSMEWGSGSGAPDVNLFRGGSNTLRTDDVIHAATMVIRGGENPLAGAGTSIGDKILLYGNAQNNVYGFGIQANRLVAIIPNGIADGFALRSASASGAWSTGTDRIVLGPAGGSNEDGIKIGADVNLFRNAANVLRTNDNLYVDGLIQTGLTGTNGRIIFNRTNDGAGIGGIELTGVNGAEMRFTHSGGSSVYTWHTNLASVIAERMRLADTGQLQLNVVGPTGGIVLGGDTNLYRFSANQLRTDDALVAVLDIAARAGVASQVSIGSYGPGSEAAISFGNGADAVLYRRPNGGSAGIALVSQVTTGGFSLVGTDATADASAKASRIGAMHFTNAEEPITMMMTSAPASGTATLNIGGGTGVGNAHTTISFYTAANSTTLTGTERMRISSAGDLDVLSNMSVGGQIASARTSGSRGIAVFVSGDTQPTISLQNNTGISFGAGGVSVTDVTLSRSGPNILSIDNALQINGSAIGTNGAAVRVNAGGGFYARQAGPSTLAFATGVQGDAQAYRWTITQAGAMSWTDGTAVADVFLQRSTAGFISITGGLALSDRIQITRPTTGNTASIWNVTGDVNARLLIAAGGTLVWGDGTAIGDTNLARTGIGSLTLTGMLVVTNGMTVQGLPVISSRAGSTADGYKTAVIGDAVDRFVIRADGHLRWSDGTNANDTNLYRSAANVLRTDDTFQAFSLGSISGSVGDVGYTAFINGDTVNRFLINAAGDLSWGGGALSRDTVLARTGAAILTLTGALLATSTLRANTGLASQVDIGAKGPGSEAGIAFGSSLDTSLYRSAADTLRTDDSFIVGGSTILGGTVSLSHTAGSGFISFIEQSVAPAAAPANGVRIYAEDNGSGKTRLMAKFNTGAAVQIAIEP